MDQEKKVLHAEKEMRRLLGLEREYKMNKRKRKEVEGTEKSVVDETATGATELWKYLLVLFIVAILFYVHNKVNEIASALALVLFLTGWEKKALETEKLKF